MGDSSCPAQTPVVLLCEGGAASSEQKQEQIPVPQFHTSTGAAAPNPASGRAGPEPASAPLGLGGGR